MTSKKIMKIGIVLMIIATILLTVNMVFGLEIPSPDPAPVHNISPTATRIIGLVSYICYAAAVILLVTLGVRFMTASPEGKAEIKKSAVIYVVGAALVFAAAAILTIIKNTLGETVVTG